jgi:phenylpropionate dioxygenase-like ring-hydroxylating dioxygenase large terminal subunit
MPEPRVEPNSAAPLREMWYYALPSKQLRAGRMVARTFLGEPLLFARGRDGRAFALRDLCPHRGVQLHEGRFDGCEITCPYHGWRFDSAGNCTAIPSLIDSDKFDPRRIRVKLYPVREMYGNLWVFFGDDPTTAAEIPAMPGIDVQRQPDLTTSLHMSCSIDEGVFSQMDPAHNQFVHVSWWWRKRSAAAQKSKAFGPAPYGFTMLPHKPSNNLLLYKLLGGAAETQIFFLLPSLRIEHIRFGKHQLVMMNALTPTVPNEVESHTVVYWTPRLLTAVKPLLQYGVRRFASQDAAMMATQSRGLRYHPAMLFVDDADTQAKWYHRLKNEYARAQAEKRPFVNPVKERVLHFRS